jgi:uncharacterized protein with NAD-binding domain and iron-sulfur cluster
MKIAILGGGVGAMAAAWKLAKQGTHDITVYQRDGKLGGKCASTRNDDPNLGNRIEEHGIHLLMGFYDELFGMLRECYDSLNPLADKILPWQLALTPCDEVTMADPVGAAWKEWKMRFPPNEMVPGNGPPPTIVAMAANAFGWLITFLNMIPGAGASLPSVTVLKQLVKIFFQIVLFLMSLGLPVGWLLGIVKWWLDKTVVRTWQALSPFVALSDELRRLWIAVWFTATNLSGMIEDDILKPPHDFTVIDHMDYRQWLQTRSAPVAAPATLAWNSPPVDAIYDLAFCNNRQLSAGTVLYNSLHIALGYKGNLSYKMNAGMGEIVFVPLYLALKNKGVKFKFFHDVTALRYKEDPVTHERWIDSVEFTKQDPDNPPYAPLVDFAVTLPDGTPGLLQAWPHTPTDTFTAAPAAHTIHKGTDFEVVVLGIGVGALKTLCADLTAVDANFDQMTTQIQTVPTQSMQVWLDKPMNQLSASSNVMFISGPRPFNSWVDMTPNLSGREPWPPGGGPQAVVYFCDEYVDQVGMTPQQIVDDTAGNFLQNHVTAIWPTFAWADLHDPNGGINQARLAAQYLRANVDPSDGYVIFAPNTNEYRLDPGHSGFRNLALAGDWVRTRLNSGCVEAAVLGGNAAAAAIQNGQVHS